MDKKIEKSKWQKHKSKIYVLIVIFSATAIALYFMSTSIYSIPEKQIRIEPVEYGDFQEIAVANGNVQPKRSILIDANEGGRVVKKLKEDGDTVKAGENLLLLQNEALVLDYMQRETQVVEQLNNLRNTQISLHQNLRSLEDEYALTQKERTRLERKFSGDSVLYEAKALSKNEYKNQLEERNHLINKSKILAERLREDKLYLQKQNDRILASIELMERNLSMIRSKIDEMNLMIPLTGRLTSFDVEIGQVLAPNEIIGRVDEPGAFKLVAQVDQHYLNRVVLGQSATIKVSGESFDLLISKVKQNVVNGQFEIELLFRDEVPENLSRGQSFQISIAISGMEKTLKIHRGSYFASSGGKFVYVLKGDKAYKRKVVFGKQNPMYYQIIEGLTEGEQVITSSYDGFLNENEILIIE